MRSFVRVNSRTRFRAPWARLVLALFVILVGLAVVSPAYSAVPNDDQATATAIVGPFPFTDLVDLHDATTSPEERAQCPPVSGTSPWENAVWYRYTAGLEDEVLLYNFQPFDVAFGVAVAIDGGPCFVPEPTQTQPIQLAPGQTVYLAAGRLLGNELGTLAVYADVRRLTHISIAVNAQATANRAGYAYVSGRLTCDATEDVAISVSMSQKTGHGVVPGTGLTVVTCEPAGPSSWTVEVQPTFGGKFVAGKAVASVDAFCSTLDYLCTRDSRSANLKLVAKR
jgi:hypothetical protein